MSLGALDIGQHAAAAMGREAIPNDQQLSVQLPSQAPQEIDELGTLDRTRVEPAREVPDRDASNGRQHLPVEGQLQHRGWPPRGPRSHPMRALAQAGFVNKDDRPAFGGSVFLTGAIASVSSTGWRLRPAGEPGRWDADNSIPWHATVARCGSSQSECQTALR